MIIGERLNANGSERFRRRLLDGDWEAITPMARAQAREGAHALDVGVDCVGRDGDIAPVVDRLATQSTLPLVIDSTEPALIATALRRLGGRAGLLRQGCVRRPALHGPTCRAPSAGRAAVRLGTSARGAHRDRAHGCQGTGGHLRGRALGSLTGGTGSHPAVLELARHQGRAAG